MLEHRGRLFLLYSEKKVTLGKNGKLLPRGGKSYILKKCYRECYRECYRKKPVIPMVFGLKVTRLHFFSIEKKIKEVKAKKIYNS